MLFRCSKCPFYSEFHFSVAAHEKLSHQMYPWKELFYCYTSYIEKLCPEWDYKPHLKVDFDNAWDEFHEKKCENCDFKTFSKYLYFIHNFRKKQDGKCRVDRKQKIFECRQCSYKTRFKGDLKNHIFNRHTPDDQIEWLNCAHCAYKAKHPHHLARHINRKHTAEDQKTYFQCDYCSLKASTRSNLKQHTLFRHTPHEQIKWFHCAQCLFKTKHSHDLTRHVQSKHTPEEEKTYFQCDYCEFKTYNHKSLKNHIYYLHTPDDKIKWFNCAQCPYKSKHSYHLSRHNGRTHSRLNGLTVHSESAISNRIERKHV